MRKWHSATPVLQETPLGEGAPCWGFYHQVPLGTDLTTVPQSPHLLIVSVS